MLLPCTTRKSFSPDSSGDHWRVGCRCRMARQCHPLGSTDQPRHSTRSRDPTSLMGYSSAQRAGDMAILSQTFHLPSCPLFYHIPGQNSFSIFPSLCMLGYQIPFLISSSQSVQERTFRDSLAHLCASKQDYQGQLAGGAVCQIILQSFVNIFSI